MEKTLVLIKPDGVKRKLVGSIIKRIEEKGFEITKMKMEKITRGKAGEHYEVHKGKEFYEKLIDFITSGRLVAMEVEGVDAVKSVRKLAGATNPLESELGSIRGDYGYDKTENLVHTSDSLLNAKIELERFFK